MHGSLFDSHVCLWRARIEHVNFFVFFFSAVPTIGMVVLILMHSRYLGCYSIYINMNIVYVCRDIEPEQK